MPLSERLCVQSRGCSLPHAVFGVSFPDFGGDGYTNAFRPGVLLIMFDDTIARDENIMVLALSAAPDILGLRLILSAKLHEALSTDSDVFRYQYGRLNGMVPEKPSSFSLFYPRKATNLDTDHHHVHFDVDILTRWISRDVLRFLVPVLYFQDLQSERRELRASSLTAKPVPTTEELRLCSKLRGKGYWNRKGTWFCTTKNVVGTQDHLGPMCFSSYNEWVKWESKVSEMIVEAKLNDDTVLVQKLRTARYAEWSI